MMWTTVTKLIGLAAICLLMETRAADAQIFQWTDAKGILHFTDNLHWIPEAIRNSAALIVRKDLEVKSPSAEVAPAPLAAAVNQNVLDRSDDGTTEFGTTVIIDAPEDASLVVVDNSNSRRVHTHRCKFGGNCQPIFRPSIADRRYIHPSVFDGGSRQYIHPGSQSFPKPTRRHLRARR